MTTDDAPARDLADFLTGDRCAQVCDAYRHIASKYGEVLRIQTTLRGQFPDLDAAKIAAVMQQMELRARASKRLALHADSLYTRTALEQSSSAAAAALHASLFEAGSRLVDICAGIGSDAAALAARSSRLVAIEADAATARLCRHNLSLFGYTHVLMLAGTAEQWMPSLDATRIDGVFADPSRRMDGTRRVDPEDASPPLSWLRTLAERVPRMVVKIAPAADVVDDFWQRVFVAVGDECAEQLLVHGAELPPVAAVDAATQSWWVPQTAQRDPQSPVPVDALLGAVRYVAEPHGAIIRTGAVAQYFAEIGMQAVDPRIAYGWSADEPASCMWHVRYRVLAALRWERRRVREALATLGFGPATVVKKRGFRVDADEARRLLAFPGDRAGVVILTRIGHEHVAFLCERAETRRAMQE